MKVEEIKFSENCDQEFIFKQLIEFYTEPVFGSKTKREMDIKMFQVMTDLGVLSKGSSLYELEAKLLITRAKARSFRYEEQ